MKTKTDWKNYKSKEETKTPLFKSEDGFDIYFDDKIYRPILQNHSGQCFVYECNADNTCGNENSEWFKEKENAINYIVENKECLCLNDIKNKGKWFIDVEVIRQLIKTKLGL